MATPAEIVARVQQNLMDATASDEIAARILEFIGRAQQELEDARFSPAQHGVVVGTPTTLSTALVAKPADWIGIRLDLDADPIVAPHYLTGDGEVKYLQPPYFTDEPEVIRARYGYADNVLLYPDLITYGAPEIIALDENGALDPAGTTTARLRVYPHSDANNSVGAFEGSGLYPVRIPYWKRLSAFDGSTVNWFTTNCEKYLEWAATAHGLIASRDLGGAAAWVTSAAGEISRLRERAREGRSASLSTIRGRGYALGTSTLRSRRVRNGGL